ncbi:MAG: DUF1207 domain-containing protein [Planctomycetes bacterium]|nr:DUF1207 domain-containing protein [Planctomycetota bacterium]
MRVLRCLPWQGLVIVAVLSSRSAWAQVPIQSWPSSGTSAGITDLPTGLPAAWPIDRATPLPVHESPPQFVDAHVLLDGPRTVQGTSITGSGLFPDPAESTSYSLAPSQPSPACWTWQFLPDGLIYRSYLAAGKEPRLGCQVFYQTNRGWLWDITLGGRVGMFRYGTHDPVNPEGWQIDLEGAAFPRLDPELDRDLVSADFRFGIPFTWRRGPWEGKVAYYHLSSHLGDEFMLANPGAFTRINYSRDVLVAAVAWRPHSDWRFYAEAGWAFYADEGSDPWEFQFGIDYSPARPTVFWPAPFLALNTRLRQEVDYGGNFTAQAGVQWRGMTGRLFRLGAHYFNGMSDQYQFVSEYEEQVGLGVWYDY